MPCQISSSRVMIRALMGSFWMALERASRASSSLGYDSSKSVRPGFTTATQYSGLPLPEPMRVSAGFLVTGLSGNTLIQTLPPRLIERVMAIRAASIWRAVSQPGSSAWIPYSPKWRPEPPLVRPFVRPRWCLRWATLRGISMVRSLSLLAAEVRRVVALALRGALGDGLFFVEQLLELGVGVLDQRLRLRSRCLVARATGGHDLARPGTLTRGLADGHGGLAGDLVLVELLVGQDVALVDPDLHTDAAAGGLGLAHAVVDVGAQRVQRDATFAVPLGAAHLGTAQAARALHPDAEGTGALGVLHGALHGPAEGDAVDELVGHTLGDQRCVEFGVLDLDDVELDLWVAGDLGDQLTDLVGLGAATSDHDARTGRVHVDTQLVTGALDLDATDRRRLETLHDLLADGPVLGEVVLVLTLGEPARLPVGGHSQAEAVRIDLLTHYLVAPSSSASLPPRDASASSLALPSAGSSASAVAFATSASSDSVAVSASVSAVASAAVSSMAVPSAAASSASAATLAVVSTASRSSAAAAVASSASAASAASPAVVSSPVCSAAFLRLRSTRERRLALLLCGRPRPAAPPARSWRAWRISMRSSLVRATTTVMWHVRLLMRVARPRARGRNRRNVGPSSAKQATTNSSSASWSSLFTALAA